jgi:hypothetical protein
MMPAVQQRGLMPDHSSTLAALREPGAFGGNPPLWAEARAARPARLPFLEPAAIPARRRAAGLPPDRDPLLVAMAAEITASPELSALAWYLHWRTFLIPENGSAWGAPALLERLGNRAGLFYLLLSLEFPPALADLHRRRGYPESVTAQTVQQIACYESNHLRGRGGPGMYENQFIWLAAYFSDPFVRLGRFEYQLHGFAGGVRVWRRIADGLVLALAEEGARVSDDGLRLDAKAPADQGWTARCEESADAVAGFPVDPAGRILRRTIRLDRTAWRPFLTKGDPVLGIHIPAGGGMTPEAVADSFRQALDFFPRHHPGTPFAAAVCTTWFLDPRLADILPAEANMLRFQRSVYQFPVCGGPGGLWFVFQKNPATTGNADLPRDTALRRSLAGYLKAGGQWAGGGMFIPREDMTAPRENRYREAALICQGASAF